MSSNLKTKNVKKEDLSSIRPQNTRNELVSTVPEGASSAVVIVYNFNNNSFESLLHIIL